MICNEAVRRLMETDRNTLVDLMAVAFAHGGFRGGLWNTWTDPDVRELLKEAEQRNALPERWQASLERWNAAAKVGE